MQRIQERALHYLLLSAPEISSAQPSSPGLGGRGIEARGFNSVCLAKPDKRLSLISKSHDS